MIQVSVVLSCDRCGAASKEPEALGREAARRAIDQWHADSVPAGWARIAIGDNKMTMLAVFCPECLGRNYRISELLALRDKMDTRSRAEWEANQQRREPNGR